MTPLYCSWRTCSLKRVFVKFRKMNPIFISPVMLLKQINFYEIYFPSTKTEFITWFHTSINVCTRQNKTLGHGRHDPGFDSRREQKMFLFSKTPSPAHPAHYSMGTGVFLWGESGRVMKPITHFHPEPRLRRGGDIILLPHTPSWCGQAKLYLNPFRLVRYPYVHALTILLSNTPYPLAVQNKRVG